AIAYLLYGRYTRQRQEETEVVRKLFVLARDCFTTLDILRFKVDTICGENKPCLGLFGGRAVPKLSKLLRDLARICDNNMNVIRLQNTAKVRLICIAGLQALYRGFLVAKGTQERKRKFNLVERLECQF